MVYYLFVFSKGNLILKLKLFLLGEISSAIYILEAKPYRFATKSCVNSWQCTFASGHWRTDTSWLLSFIFTTQCNGCFKINGPKYPWNAKEKLPSTSPHFVDISELLVIRILLWTTVINMKKLAILDVIRDGVKHAKWFQTYHL